MRYVPRLNVLAVAVALAVMAAPVSGQPQMPDARQMSGIPRPVDDLPSGTVSVRLIRGELSNNITDHPVELSIDGRVETARTDEAGRAQFSGLTPGARLKAVAVVDGERLESQEFPAPSQGGIRLLLVATDKQAEAGAADAAKAAAITGEVVIGGESRIVVEPDDDGARVYYLLDVTNTSRAPVNTPAPFLFDTPTGAAGTAVMQGSSPLASVTGTRVRVEGPFPQGQTFVQVGYHLRSSGGTVEISQPFPAAVERLVLFVKKIGDARLSSTQVDRQQEMPAGEDRYIVAVRDSGIPAGQALEFSITGLPHHSATPRWIAMTLAAGIVLIGVWAGQRPPDQTAAAAERKRLIARREKLLQDLVRIEMDYRRGRLDQPRYTSAREELMAALEHVYGALDTDDVGPEPARRAGLAA